MVEKMKSDSLPKPPPLLLPPTKLGTNPHPRHSSFKRKEVMAEEQQERVAVHKFTAKYDAFHGILKRVSDMKLTGSLDSEEPSTESEKSESSTSRCSKRHVRSESSSIDDRSNVSGFEEESSGGSFNGSDHCPPYEEIQKVDRSRYSCVSLPPKEKGSFANLPSPPPYAEGSLTSFTRRSLPPPPSPTDLYANEPSLVVRRQNSSEYKRKDGGTRGSAQEIPRVRSLYGERERERKFSRQYSCSDVNENCTKFYGKRSSLEESGHGESITDSEKHQLEVFFRSLKTDVFICGSLANLYFGWKGSEGEWTYRHTGVVVVILDCGDTRSRRKRKIQILLAEKGTCFPLWKDTIDNLSAYHKSGSAFHTMHLSSDHRQLIGFSFDSPSEADKLLRHVEDLTSNPENINISVPGSKKKSLPKKKKKSAPLPQKKHISNPCLFQHVTSVAAKDKPIYMSLQTLIDNDAVKKKENIS